MAGPRHIAKGFKFWPRRSADEMTAKEVIRHYREGFAGVWDEPEERERLHDDIRSGGGYVSGADAAYSGGWAGSGAGKLVIPFVWILHHYPGCLPGGAQGRGDCCSWSERNCCLTTLIGDIIDAEPDEETGRIEGPPEVSDAAIRAAFCLPKPSTGGVATATTAGVVSPPRAWRCVSWASGCVKTTPNSTST